ncbi:MAG: ribokinase [Eubacteriales bacterium]|nr:ribokinase [Eubacteriales bacterium]
MNKIINYGSLNIDRVYSVEDFVLPGQTISSRAFSVFPGGKGLNQSIAAAKAGSLVYHAGAVGEDGQFLVDFLKKSGVRTELIATSRYPTGHAIIQVNRQGQNCIILHAGSNDDLSDQLRERVVNKLNPGDLLVIQNEVNNNRDMMEKAIRRKARIALNPSPYNQEINDLPLEAVSWLFINEVEGREMTGTDEPDEICARLIRRYPDLAVVLTLGSSGVLYQDERQKVRHGIYQVPVVDTTAAGDTFTGYFLSGIVAGLPIDKILQQASMASAIVVSREGAAVSIPTIKEVNTFSQTIKISSEQ